MPGRVDQINTRILRQCREQVGLNLSEVQKKVGKIPEIENGELKPTFKQLDTLSSLYGVPRWVFISDELPEEYQFDKAIPAFRQFARQKPEQFDDPKLRRLTAKVERLRELLLELLEDMDEVSLGQFTPPEIREDTDPETAAKLVRSWLGYEETSSGFLGWRSRLEDKGVFVFLTSKYRGQSNIDKTIIRGLSIYHDVLPIVIINDSDAKKSTVAN